MFKFTICLIAALLVAFVHADHIDKNAEILSQKNDPADAEGNYAYSFDTSNGIQVQEAGNANGATGSFSWTSPEGENIALNYVADENGYQPSGESLPVPPPIPEAILRSLEYNAAHPSSE
ncbi:pupal cuticle protein Edg-78E-like [Drosophila obscura]|uniref:pupal cuticle protein Edg-78E-like n=1 Tax=Drosophila obscura TaxID=7282 RepID=UPI000BA0DA71|nr:pupal cuticle protein Edg-78E-like [Drosophila obscura]